MDFFLFGFFFPPFFFLSAHKLKKMICSVFKTGEKNEQYKVSGLETVMLHGQRRGRMGRKMVQLSNHFSVM